jgi:hypothetical protein
MIQGRPSGPRSSPGHLSGAAARLQARLEAGEVICLPDLVFDLGAADPARFAAAGGRRSRHVSYDPLTGALRGASGDEAAQAWLAGALEAYAAWALDVVREVLPAYAPRLAIGKGSFRPRPADLALSRRRDDRRLHIDAYPSQPVQGRRILRVFRNVNPAGEDRVWRLGEPFIHHAARFLPGAWSRRKARPPAWLLQATGLTKGRRTAYDALMLGLHDLARACDTYQAEAPRETLAFPPGATWLVFGDAAPHAALSGRFAFEQTFLLPVDAMADPDAAPLRVLERMTGERLA